MSRDSAEFLLVIVCRVFRIFLWHCSYIETTGLVSTLTWSYRSPGTLRRLMLIWIRMESMSFRRLGFAFTAARSGCCQGVASTG